MGTNSYKQFRNRYIFVSDIGKGNFGEVFKVKDTVQNIIKVEKKSIKPIQPNYKQKILEQPKLLIKLNHPNIIKGYEYIIDQKSHELSKSTINQYLHIIMEYFEGKSLEMSLGKLNKMQVLEIYKQIKSAIVYLQNQNIVHRDISLDNILVDENMNIKITDFGIASDLKGEKYYQTKIGHGKDSYRSPQVWNNKVSMNSDLWALGIIVLELYFGVRISKLYKSKPGDREQFPTEFYEMKKGKIPQEIMRIVEPLLQRDHNKRKFYEDENEDRVIIFKHIKTDKKITKKMTELYLYNNNIGTEGAVEIAKNLKNLTYLSLDNNNIGTAGAVEIAKNLKNLTQLYLDDNNIGTEGAVEIAKNLKNLTWLSLNDNNIGTEGAVEIAKNLKNLTWLSLNDNNIGTEGAVEIAKNLKNLTYLSLDNNNIGTEGAVEIAKNLKNLTYLSLDNNNIGTEGAVEIAKNLKNLIYLSLDNNNIRTEGAVEIAKNLKNLTWLSLNNNNIGTEGAVEIAKNLKNLTQLYLDNNNIRTEGAVEIAKNLKNLTWLSLKNNKIDEQGKTLIRSLTKAQYLYL